VWCSAKAATVTSDEVLEHLRGEFSSYKLPAAGALFFSAAEMPVTNQRQDRDR